MEDLALLNQQISQLRFAEKYRTHYNHLFFAENLLHFLIDAFEYIETLDLPQSHLNYFSSKVAYQNPKDFFANLLSTKKYSDKYSFLLEILEALLKIKEFQSFSYLQKIKELLNFKLKNFQVNNFRGFKNLEVKDFKTINLFTGKNNTGKTSLLEAINLALSSRHEVLGLRFRQSENDPDLFQNCFFDENKEIKFLFQIQNQIFTKIGDIYQGDFRISPPENESAYFSQDISFILSNYAEFPQSPSIVKEWDDAAIKGQSDEILEAFKLIDSSIESVMTYASRGQILYLKKDKFLPINYYGDAIRKIARYIFAIKRLEIAKTGGGFLLIDEIENGLHHSIQADFWEMLIKLAICYEVQIFATTHSKEMVEHFLEIVDRNKWQNEVAYYEMFKNFENQDIIAQKLPLDVIGYRLEVNKDFRG